MKRLSWLITLPFAVLLVVFAVNNRDTVAFDLWPTGLVIELPLYLAVLGALVIGFVAGGAVVWVSSAPLRRALRRQRRQVSELEREVGRLKATAAEDENEYAVPPRQPQPKRNVLSLPRG